MRTALLLCVMVFLGCQPEQFKTANVGTLLAPDAGCPATWPEASPLCRGTATRACPSVDRCTYVEMGDCFDVGRPCADAVAECDASDGGATWTCAQ